MTKNHRILQKEHYPARGETPAAIDRKKFFPEVEKFGCREGSAVG